MPTHIGARLRIAGKVQGVWYRAHARDRGHELGLVGRVRNLPDGTVEAVVEGLPESIEAFVAWCKVGPPAARVESVQFTQGPPRGLWQDFQID